MRIPSARTYVLTAVSALLLLLIFLLPWHRKYGLPVMLKNLRELPGELRVSDAGKRMEQMHAGNYSMPQIISAQVPPGQVFLLPPEDYVAHYLQTPTNWANPYLFYYMNPDVRTCRIEDASCLSQTRVGLLFTDQGGFQFTDVSTDSLRRNLLSWYQYEMARFRNPSIPPL